MYTSNFKRSFFFFNLELSLGFARFSGYHTDDIPTDICFESDAYRFFSMPIGFHSQSFLLTLFLFVLHIILDFMIPLHLISV